MMTSWPPIPNQSFGTQFRIMRIEAGLSLRHVAKVAGISPTFLADIENNRRMPSRTHLEKLAAAIARPLGDLLQHDPRQKLAALLDVISRRPDITALVTEIAQGLETGIIDINDVKRLAGFPGTGSTA